MKLTNAIEILSDYHARLPLGLNDDYVDALKLGIVALKRIKITRSFGNNPGIYNLPGETPEGDSP